MLDPQHRADVLSEAAKAAPAVAVSTATIVSGFTLNEWAIIGTIVYIVLQICWLLWKWHRAATTKDWTPDK